MAPLATFSVHTVGYVKTVDIGCSSQAATGKGPLTNSILSTSCTIQCKSLKANKVSKKSVSFNESVSCRRTTHLKQYTDEEIAACWYTEAEFREIKADVKFAVEMIKNGYLEKDTNQYCKRGLEHLTTMGTLRRHKLKIATREAVMDEQDIQQQQHQGAVLEPELIAFAYRIVSNTAMEFARAIALCDELEADM